MMRLNPISARSFGFAVISVAVALSSSGCNLFGGGDDDGGGGTTGFTPTDAQVAELIMMTFDTHAALVVEGVESASGSGSFPVAGGCSMDVTVGSPMTAYTECNSTVPIPATSCGTASNFTWTAGTRFVGGLVSGSSTSTFNLDVNGYVTGGFVTAENLQLNCVLKHTFTNGDYNTYEILSLVGCTNADSDTMSCTIGSRTLDCEEIKSLLTAQLPSSCVNAE